MLFEQSILSVRGNTQEQRVPMQFQLARLFLHWRWFLTFAGHPPHWCMLWLWLNGVQQEGTISKCVSWIRWCALMTASSLSDVAILVSSQIPVRLLTLKSWTSVPPSWPCPGKWTVMSPVSISTTFRSPARTLSSISTSVTPMPSSLPSRRVPYTTSQCILSLSVVQGACRSFYKCTPVSLLIVLLTPVSSCCVPGSGTQSPVPAVKESTAQWWVHRDCGPFSTCHIITGITGRPYPHVELHATCVLCAVLFNVLKSVTWWVLALLYGWGSQDWERCALGRCHSW